jgi:hypothetical protein
VVTGQTVVLVHEAEAVDHLVDQERAVPAFFLVHTVTVGTPKTS